MSLILVASAILRCSICSYAFGSHRSICPTIGRISAGLRLLIVIDLYSRGEIVLDTFSWKDCPFGHFIVIMIVHVHGVVAVK